MPSVPPTQPGQKDQLHPQRDRDRHTLDRLLREEANEFNLAELARLRIRYKGFPGSWDMQKDMDKLLEKLQLTEGELFEQTRNIHASKQIYTVRSNKREDWT